MARAWTETQFEKWFLNNPFLPNEERVLVIDKQSPLRRVVDLVALDQDGGLVIVEVKNEKSTRTVVGQSVEYLAQYQARYITIDTLSDLYGGSPLKPNRSLRDDFERMFGKKLSEISARRRVYIAGPSFDAYSDICVQYLNDKLRRAKITFSLLAVSKVGSKFCFREERAREWLPSKNLAERRFYMSPGRFVYYVLSAGASPVLWKIGRQRNGNLDPLTGSAARHVLVRRHVFSPIGGSPREVRTELTGTTWRHRTRSTFTATVIGVVDRGGKGPFAKARVVIARYDSNQFKTLSVRLLRRFKQKYRQKDTLNLPDWSGIAAAAESAGQK